MRILDDYTDVYKEGYDAYVDDLKNPYEPGTWQWAAWESGRIDAILEEGKHD